MQIIYFWRRLNAIELELSDLLLRHFHFNGHIFVKIFYGNASDGPILLDHVTLGNCLLLLMNIFEIFELNALFLQQISLSTQPIQIFLINFLILVLKIWFQTLKMWRQTIFVHLGKFCLLFQIELSNPFANLLNRLALIGVLIVFIRLFIVVWVVRWIGLIVELWCKFLLWKIVWR